MRAEILRRAASRMRDQANAVDALGQLTEHIADVECDEFADFIAAWDPIVARAVAEWLDRTARLINSRPPTTSPATAERIYAEAFAVARAYLGERA